jgi:hypothetical protein
MMGDAWWVMRDGWWVDLSLIIISCPLFLFMPRSPGFEGRNSLKIPTRHPLPFMMGSTCPRRIHHSGSIANKLSRSQNLQHLISVRAEGTGSRAQGWDEVLGCYLLCDLGQDLECLVSSLKLRVLVLLQHRHRREVGEAPLALAAAAAAARPPPCRHPSLSLNPFPNPDYLLSLALACSLT